MTQPPMFRVSAARAVRGAAVGVGVALLAAAGAAAQDVKGSSDHPNVTRFSGATIREYQSVAFDSTAMPVKPVANDAAVNNPPAGAVLTLEGKITRINYEIPAGKSSVEVMRNYEQALGGKFTTVFSCAGNACGASMVNAVDRLSIRNPWRLYFATDLNQYLVAKRSSPDGDVYVQLYVMQESGSSRKVLAFQQVVELKPMQTGQVAVLDAAALKGGLEAEGKVAVYGIYFDTGKADVKPESRPTLEQMARLLSANKALKVYIVGHTDNAGTLAGNLDLSGRRAEAVVRALVSGHKVDGGQLLAKGVASLAPVASNTSEAGRAKNRRVELVVQ